MSFITGILRHNWNIFLLTKCWIFLETENFIHREYYNNRNSLCSCEHKNQCCWYFCYVFYPSRRLMMNCHAPKLSIIFIHCGCQLIAIVIAVPLGVLTIRQYFAVSLRIYCCLILFFSKFMTSFFSALLYESDPRKWHIFFFTLF